MAKLLSNTKSDREGIIAQGEPIRDPANGIGVTRNTAEKRTREFFE
jgi:hypothetical protein